ncbi:hypothetical protein EYF80_063870 [Liparis tanakae]|uniref:Uncharacterized protein n=1 Tax=Liparis tanakae TaxID=230148 RepID=A0A4Z2EBR8_9TELE|nr:hypothetical protein EYF80_063870 [Liparis tanakae]
MMRKTSSQSSTDEEEQPNMADAPLARRPRGAHADGNKQSREHGARRKSSEGEHTYLSSGVWAAMRERRLLSARGHPDRLRERRRGGGGEEEEEEEEEEERRRRREPG